MVLSNKKLKRKFRSLLADSIAASESNKKSHHSDVTNEEEFNNIKQLLESKSRKKPNSSKPRARRKKTPKEGGETTEQGDGGSVEKKDEFKSKEMKRGAKNGEDGGLNENKKKKKKPKERKKKEQQEDGKESKVGGENGEDGGLKENKKKEKKKKKKKKPKEKKKEEQQEDGKESKVGEENEGSTKSVDIEINEAMVQEPINMDESEMKKVYVGGIPYYSSEDDIRSFFEGCGTIMEVDCMTFPETGKFRGIAFLTFKTEAAAKRALALDGADMGGFYLKIQPYKAQRSPKKSDFAPEIVEGYNRAYVGNLSWDITEDDLKQFFSDCKISSIRFGMDKETGEFKGYAHVDFSDSVSLAIALKLDQKVVCGRPAKISCAVPNKGVETSLGKKKTPPTEAENDGSGGGKKKKRRTCYECGVPGHLSSSCPQKRTKPEITNVAEC